MINGELARNITKQDYRNYNFNSDGAEQGFQLIGMDWSYIYVNETAVWQYGFDSPGDLLGFTLMEKFPDIQGSPVFRQLELAMYEGASCILEYEFVFPTGFSRWFELSVAPFLFGIVVLSTDITEKKKKVLVK